jgi:hypothetical protein
MAAQAKITCSPGATPMPPRHLDPIPVSSVVVLSQGTRPTPGQQTPYLLFG